MKSKLTFLVVLLLAGLSWGAGEIALQGYLKAQKGARTVTRSPGTAAVDWNGSKIYGPVIYSVTPTYQAITNGAITTNGIVWVANVDTTATVSISFDGGSTDHINVKTNEFFCFRLSPTLAISSVKIKTTSARTNDFEVTILED